MDKTELDIQQLRWRISILQSLLVDAHRRIAPVHAPPVHASHVTEQETHAHTRQHLYSLIDAAHRHGRERILASDYSPDHPLLVAQEFDRVVDEVKASIDLLLSTSSQGNI